MKLGEFADVNMGQSPMGDSLNETDGMEFHQGKIFFGELDLEVSPIKTTAPAKCAKPGDVLICVRAPVGVVNITNREVCIGRGLAALTPKDGMPNRFLLHLLRYHKKVFDGIATGSTFASITTEQLRNIDLPIPLLSVQRRIAEVLGAMDEKIAVNRRKIAELEALAKTVYDYWFVQFDFPDAHGRPYRSSGGKMTWNASLKREVPDGWEVGKLETVFDVCSGCDHKHLPDGRYPVLGSGGVMRYAAEYLYDKESVLIPRKGTLNNVMFMQEPFWTVDTMFYTRPRRKWMMKYAYMTIKDFDFARLNTGTGVPSMTASIINRISIPIPPQDVAQKFDAFLTGLFDGIETSRRQIRELTLQRDALLPLLMNGQVEVA